MIVALIGDVGSGKTLSMTYIIHHAQRNPKKIQKMFRFLYGDQCYFESCEYNVYTNYHLTDIPYNKIDNTLGALDNIHTENNILALDELWQSADSRESITLPNKILTRFFAQSRKSIGDSSHLFHTAQLLHSIDIRIRNLTPYLILPEVLIYQNIHTHKKSPIKNTSADIPYLLELKAYKKMYLSDYIPVSSYPIKVSAITKYYDYEELVPLMVDNMLDEMREKYRKLIEKQQITTKQKLMSKLVIDEKMRKQDAKLIADYLM